MQYNSKVNLVKKLFLPISLFLLSSFFISIILFNKYHSKHIQHLSNSSFIKVEKELEKKFRNDITDYKEFIKLISKDQNAVKLFLTNDRDGLYNYYRELFEEWVDVYSLSHFYFHKKDKVNFLRVHNYKKHSDTIDRTTLNKSIQTNSLGAGIEFGIAHNLTLRVVYPWFYEDGIIGYIELGKEIDYFTPELAKINGVEVVFTIKKELISKDSYKEWLKYSINNLNFKEMDNYYIIDSSFKRINENIYSILDSKDNIADSLPIKVGEKWFYINSKDFIDSKGDEIGKMIVIQDFTKQHQELFSVIEKISMIIILLGMILLVYYYLLLKKEEFKLERNQNRYIHLSIVDSLTGLYNRRYFDNHLKETIMDLNNIGKFITLIIADIDNFKKYNDNYGHGKGDEILVQVATCIKKTLRRSNDKCFRIGGEEFTVVLISDNIEIGKDISNNIKENIENLNLEHLYNENYKKITLSLGVHTLKVEDATNIKTFFEQADSLLYESKKNGRNKVTSNID